jgi:hypothetical protein
VSGTIVGTGVATAVGASVPVATGAGVAEGVGFAQPANKPTSNIVETKNSINLEPFIFSPRL